MAVGMNEYNELVVTAKVVTKLCSPKGERDVNVRKKPSWKQKMKTEINICRGLSTASVLERGINLKEKMCKKLKRKYKLNEKIKQR